MPSLRAWLGVTGLLTTLTLPSVVQAQLTYRITLENLTGGQPFSPYVFVTHDASETVWAMGETASPGIQQIAEEGDKSVLLADLSTQIGGSVGTILSASKPLLPGLSSTFHLSTDSAHTLLSSAWMLGVTNDGFSGTSGLDLTARSGTTVFNLVAYDAGTEVNNELAAFLPAFGGILNDPERGVIDLHPGIQGVGDIGQERNFSNPVARLTITQVPEPGVNALLFAGGVAFLGLARRRRS